MAEEARKNFTEVQAHLKERVQAAGVPAEQADAEVAALEADLQSVKERIEQPNPGFSEARNLNIVLGTAQMNLQRKVQEMRARYQPKDPLPSQEIHLHWQDLLGTSRISSQDDLEQMLGKLRECITPELEQQKIVVIE